MFLNLYNKNKPLIITAVILTKILLVMWLIPYFTELYPGFYHANLFPDSYDQIAENLIKGIGYKIYPETGETMQRLPGFVFFLAALFSAFGKSLVAVKLANLVFSFLTAYLVILIGKRFFNYDKLAYLAAFVFLFYPGSILAESRGGLESMFTFFLTAFVYWYYKALATDRTSSYFGAGVFLGVSAIIKSTTLIMPAVLFFHLVFAKGKKFGLGYVIKHSFLIALPMVLLLSPWAMRNYAISDAFVLTQANMGTAAYQGLKVNLEWPSERDHNVIITEATEELNVLARQMNLKFKYDFFQHFYDPKDEILFDRYVSNLVKQQYVESPMLLVKSSLLNFSRFWFQGRTGKSSLMNVILVAPLLLFVMVGLYQLFRQGVNIWPMFIIVGFFIAGHLPILGTARYHIPLIPLLCLVAVAALPACAKWVHGLRHQTVK